MYRNDGVTMDLSIKVPMASNNPSLRIFTVDLSADGVVGRVYKFKIRTFNVNGYTESSALSVALASLPSKPSTVPTSIASKTNQYQLTAQITPFDATNNGGSPILNYEIQFDDGLRGAYSSVFTLSPIINLSSGIFRGRQYRLRYRALNFNGWGPFSEIGYIKAATVPSIPPAPVLYGSTASTITLLIVPPTDDGGVIITIYKLWFDTLQTIPGYQLAYTGSSTSVTLNAADIGLLSSTIYRFKVQATNEFGDSDYSEDLKASLGSVPSKPHSPVKVEIKSSKNSIAVEWQRNDDSVTAMVTGYKLLMDDGFNGEYSVIYDGSGFPNTFAFIA